MVTDQGNDSGLLKPVIEQIEKELEQATGEKETFKRVIVDGGYSGKKEIEEMETRGTKVYSPPPNSASEKKKQIDPYTRRKNESKKMGEFRERMGQEEAKKVYKKRSPIAEGVHAQQRNRGFNQMRLRGLEKESLETRLQALSYNLDLYHRLTNRRSSQKSTIS